MKSLSVLTLMFVLSLAAVAQMPQLLPPPPPVVPSAPVVTPPPAMIPASPNNPAAVYPPDNVIVVTVKLFDSDNYWYGSQFELTSTVNTDICVMPYVVPGSASNVIGSVVQMMPMKAFEKNVNIGQYKTADENQPWRVIVKAKWRKGNCADK